MCAQSSFTVPVQNTSGTAITGATVTLTCTDTVGGCFGKGPFTAFSTNGNATFAAIPQGNYTVTISGTGLTTYSYAYTVDGGLTKPLASDAIQFVSTNGDDSNDGSSMGTAKATIAAAQTALPASGGRVYIAAGTYTIALGSFTMSKQIGFYCQSRTSTIITFTGASGIGVLVNYATSATGDYRDWGNGFHDCQLVGPGGLNGGVGNAGTLFQIGDATHASQGFLIDDDLISGFGLALTWQNASAWGTRATQSNFINNNQQVLYNLTGSTGIENVEFDHCVFGADQFATGMLANAVAITGSSQGHFKFIDPSFDGAQLVVTAGFVDTVNANHENPGGNTTNTYTVVNGASAFLMERSPDYRQDNSSGSVPMTFVNNTAGVYVADGPYYFTNATMTNAVTGSGAGMYIAFTRGVSGTFTTAYNFTTTPFLNLIDQLGNINFGGPLFTTTSLRTALTTKSSAYTLTASDSWINVTGTTTITVPHALTGQRWDVFNSGVATVTLACDTGTINGAANITIATEIGKSVTADGTNCFAH